MGVMTDRRVFISYVRENQQAVERIVSDLRQQGFDVWFDRESLLPGAFWKDEIRTAIHSGGAFIACFSSEYNARAKTYMNEELEIAIEEIRLRGNSPWFIPVRLSGDIPDRAIGAGRSLRDIQFVDFVEVGAAAGTTALVRSLKSFRAARAAPAASAPTQAVTKSLPPSVFNAESGYTWIELAGAGQAATRQITLNSGLYRVALDHYGSSNFIVRMLAGDGVAVETVANKIGAFHGSKAVRIVADGKFLFDVTASGAWIIRVFTPAVISSEGAFAGSDQAATDLFHLESGLRVFQLSHKGRSNFIVRLLDEAGNALETLINHIGPVNASKPVGVRGGQYMLDIAADGEWLISHE